MQIHNLPIHADLSTLVCLLTINNSPSVFSEFRKYSLFPVDLLLFIRDNFELPSSCIFQPPIFGSNLDLFLLLDSLDTSQCLLINPYISS